LAAAYAAVVFDYGRMAVTATVRKKCAGLHSHIGELLGVVAALKTIPDQQACTVHSDQIHLWEFNNLNKSSLLYEPMKQFKEQQQRLSTVRLRFIPRKNRNDLYRWCHNAARLAINLSVDEDWKQLNREIQRKRNKE